MFVTGSQMQMATLCGLGPRADRPDSRTCQLRTQISETPQMALAPTDEVPEVPKEKERFRLAFGVPQYELVEVRQLGELVLDRILSDGTMARDVYAPWVASRFTYPLRALLFQANRSSRAAVALNLAVVAGGFATSGIAVAAGGGQRLGSSWIVFSLGLVVAAAGGLAQLFRPAYRSTERTTLAVELREEAWAFATQTGSYALPAREAFERLETRVSAIHRRAAKISALERIPDGSEPQGSRSRPSRTNG